MSCELREDGTSCHMPTCTMTAVMERWCIKHDQYISLALSLRNPYRVGTAVGTAELA